jgi:hypothetical protein
MKGREKYGEELGKGREEGLEKGENQNWKGLRRYALTY